MAISFPMATGKDVVAWIASPTLADLAQIGLVSAKATLVPAGTIIAGFACVPAFCAGEGTSDWGACAAACCERLAQAVNKIATTICRIAGRSEEHTSELQSRSDLVCRLLLEKKNKTASAASARESCGHCLPPQPPRRNGAHSQTRNGRTCPTTTPLPTCTSSRARTAMHWTLPPVASACRSASVRFCPPF